MTDQDLLLKEFHQAGIWLPGEWLDEDREDRHLWSRVQQCMVNAKALKTNRYRKAMDRSGPCEAPWNRHPPSRQCSCSWSASWQGLRGALARQFYCRPEILGVLIAAIVIIILAWPW